MQNVCQHDLSLFCIDILKREKQQRTMWGWRCVSMEAENQQREIKCAHALELLFLKISPMNRQ